MSDKAEERTLEQTPTWAVAAVCFVLIAVSIAIELLICRVGKWLKNRHKRALYEALEKVKTELMLMGFISLLLTIGQGPLSEICVPKRIANTWQPCDNDQEAAKYGGDTATTGDRRRLWFLYSATSSTRRSLASEKYDKCAERGEVALVSAYGIHQLHIFIFVLAVFHVLYCFTTWTLGRTKLKKWKAWEDETGTSRHGCNNDPERVSSAIDRSFGRRHLNIWSSSSISLWIVCFFRQFFGSVTKVDYQTLRHGFIMAGIPGRETEFDFNQYISSSLEEDFVVVVGITPLLWLAAVLFLLINTHGWFAYLWLPFIPLVIILLVGTKLQVIMTKLGLRIQERGDEVKVPHLFWFGRPQFILFLIHLVLFQNAFQLAFFIWSTLEFTSKSCYHKKIEDIVIKISMGIIIQILCSYVTLPLYALVTWMDKRIPTIFNDTPYLSRPATPTHGISPVQLHNYPNHNPDSYHASPSPRGSSFDNDTWDPESLPSPRQHHSNDTHHVAGSVISEEEMVI